jgi:hypothetical protein
MALARIFTPDHVRWEGVRPINIYLLRTVYLLAGVFVTAESWYEIFTHEGSWNHIRGVAVAVWASYPLLCLLGVFKPLKLLPIMVFIVLYKSIWMAVVAIPMWRAGTLVGSPAEEMARVFMWVPLALFVVPWGYFFREFVLPGKQASAIS